MYRIELIPKSSVLEDIIGPWVDSGREDNRKDGSFVFDGVKSWAIEGGSLSIIKGNVEYCYNMADLYRVRAEKINED